MQTFSSEPIATTAWSRRSLLLTVGVGALLGCARRPASQQVELFITSDGDQLTFNPRELSCPTGARVRLTFRNNAQYVSFDHNWVLILPHTFDAVIQAADAAGEAQGWLPQHDNRVLAATPMCGKGVEVVIEFIAPAVGDYPFVCTNPGHAASMWGVLHVTPV